jgi:hypothetical protein
MIVRVVEILQLFASLAMIVYVPADNDVKLPEGKYVAPLFLEYSIVPVPPEAPVLMLPLPAPLQVILVCEADVHVNIGGLINRTVPEDVQFLVSFTETVYVPAHNKLNTPVAFVVNGVVNEYVYPGVPPPPLKVTDPLHDPLHEGDKTIGVFKNKVAGFTKTCVPETVQPLASVTTTVYVPPPNVVKFPEEGEDCVGTQTAPAGLIIAYVKAGVPAPAAETILPLQLSWHNGLI